MKLCGALLMLMMLSAACGLSCYSCNNSRSEDCLQTVTCSHTSDRCFSRKQDGLNVVTKGCQANMKCFIDWLCCDRSFCNSDPGFGLSFTLGSSAIRAAAGPGVVLLLAASAVVTLFV